jgi:tRNA-specific 2-thiouridylase
VKSVKKAAIGLSGGVDSAAAAKLLIDKGFDVMGIILRLKPESGADADISDAQRIADSLGIELKVLDRRDFFKTSVIGPFVAEYLAGRTPNPCVECNAAIKFGVMLDFALENGCDFLATGHYARIEESDGRYLLKRSGSNKDQSYFLHRLTQHQLSHAIFPLEGMEKEEIRCIAFEAKLARAIKIYMRNRRIRKQRELARAYANVQSRAPAEVIEQAPVVEFRKPEFRNHYVA